MFNGPTLRARDLHAQREKEAQEKAAQEAAEKKKQKEDDDYKELLKKRENDVKRQQEHRNAAVNGLPSAPRGDTGTLYKAAHLASMTAEGVAAEMMVDAFIFAIQFIYNTSYMAQVSHYVQALPKENEMRERLYVPKAGVLPTIYEIDPATGEPDQTKPIVDPTKEQIQAAKFIHPDNFSPLIYRKDENGKYPTVYRVNEAGNINYEETYENGTAPVHAIRANGLIPVPSFTQGWTDAISAHIERMMGSDWLSPEKKLELYGYLEKPAGQENNSDLMRDRMMAQRMQGPKPTK